MLLAHNYPVYKALEEMLVEHNKAILVTATGTGKSYVTLEYLEKHDLRALVICPTIRICEDWEGRSERVTAITYQKLCRMSEFPDADCYIFDEAHHVGGEVWGKAARRLMDTHSEPIIGLTADSRRYLDGCRDVALEFWDGHVVYGYDQAEAIEKGVLPSATYVCALFGVEERLKGLKKNAISDHLMSKLEMNLRNCGSMDEILRRHMPAGPRKGIVFADNIKSTDAAVEFIHGVYPLEPVTVLHSRLPKVAQVERLRKFDSWDSGYLVAVDMFNEGIHLEGVNTVIMLRRTSSPTVFMQQLGRCLMPGNKDVAIFDFVGNNSSLRYIETQTSLFRGLGAKQHLTSQKSQFIVWDYASAAIDILSQIKETLFQHWTPEEDEIIRMFYPLEGGKCVKRLSRHPLSSVRARAHVLGIYKNGYGTFTPWTEKEDEIIRKYYETEGLACLQRLPGRTRAALSHRAGAMGLISDRSRKYQPWTPEEDDIIKKYYPAEGIKCISRIPGRTEQGLNQRACFLKVCRQRFWKKEDDDIVRRYYPTEGSSCASRLVGRSNNSVMQRAKKLGLAYEGRKRRCQPVLWTAEEEAIIREYYSVNPDLCASKLSSRTMTAIQRKASYLGVTQPKIN